MYQPYPLCGQSAEPLRPSAPAPVLTAVKLMYAGAAVSAVNLIISLAVIGGLKAYHGRFLGHSLTAAQVSDLNTVIIAAVVTGLVVIALWLWMARTNGQGRNWARILSTVLFGLATLELTPYVFGFGEVFGVTVFGLIFPLLTWLVGLAVVWLQWRPASSAFFRPQGFPQAGSGAAISSRIRSSRARPPRQW
jgi:CDP-diglyceride synthetase